MSWHYNFFDYFSCVEEDLSFFFGHENFEIIFLVGLGRRTGFLPGGIEHTVPHELLLFLNERKIRAHRGKPLFFEMEH